MQTIACAICGQVQRLGELTPGTVARCCRCSSVLRRRNKNSLARTAALSLAALVLYFPANVYPILRMEHLGAYSENTIWDGCVRLFQDGEWFVAGIVFLASILIPLLKLLALVKFKQIATVLPGPGLLAFSSVVVLTILASGSFDPRLIWEESEYEDEHFTRRA